MIVRTLKDLPFDDLSPDEFHRLVLALMIEEENEFLRVENWGETGSDGGIDIRASYRHAVTARVCTAVVQVKRTQRLSPADVGRETRKLERLLTTESIHRYIIATSSRPSANAHSTLRGQCREMGLEEAEIWDRSSLTARLQQLPDLVKRFFGHQASVAGDSVSSSRPVLLHHVVRTLSAQGFSLYLGRGESFVPHYASQYDLDGVIDRAFESFGPGDLPGVPTPLDLAIGNVVPARYHDARARFYRTHRTNGQLWASTRESARRLTSFTIAPSLKVLGSLLRTGALRGLVISSYAPHLVDWLGDQCPSLEVLGPRGLATQCPFVAHLGADSTGRLRALPSFDDADGLAAFLRAMGERHLVLMNLSWADRLVVHRLVRRLGNQTEVYCVASSEWRPRRRALPLDADPAKFLSSIVVPFPGWENVLPFAEVTFRDAPSWERLLLSERARPEDVKIAMPPPTLTAQLAKVRAKGYAEIRGLSGSGKSVLAYFLLHSLYEEGRTTFLLEGSSIEQGKTVKRRVRELILYLRNRYPSSALLVDDAHLHGITGDNFFDWLKPVCEDRRIVVILVNTTQVLASSKVGGIDVHSFVKDADDRNKDQWPEQREKLLKWITVRRASIEEVIGLPDFDASKLLESQSYWHFFFLLRGAARATDEEIAAARRVGRADLVWFAVAVSAYFRNTSSLTIREARDLVSELDLVPLSVSASQVGLWVQVCLAELIKTRRIIVLERGVAVRHPRESEALIVATLRTLEGEGESECRSAVFALFSSAIGVVELSEEEATTLLTGSKYSVRQILDARVQPFVDRLARYEDPVPVGGEFDWILETAWRGLVDVIEKADLHHLYWIVNRCTDLGAGRLKGGVWRYVRSFGGVERIRSVTDAMDLVIFLDTLVGTESIVLVESVLRSAVRRRTLRDVFKPKKRKRRLSNRQRRLLKAGKVEEVMAEHGANDAQLVALEEAIAEAEETGTLAAVPLRAMTGILERQRKEIESVSWPIAEKLFIEREKIFDNTLPLVLAHLWLASPDAAKRQLEGMSESERSTLKESILAACDYSPFHLDPDGTLFQMFVRWLGGHDRELRRTYEELLASREGWQEMDAMLQQQEQAALEGEVSAGDGLDLLR